MEASEHALLGCVQPCHIPVGLTCDLRRVYRVEPRLDIVLIFGLNSTTFGFE